MPGHRCISLITGYQHYNSLSWEKTWSRSWLTSLLFFRNSHSYAWLQRCKLLLTFCRLVVDSVTCLLVLFPVKKNCSRTEKQSWMLWTLIWYSSCQSLMRATVSLVTVFVLLMRYQPLWTVQRPRFEGFYSIRYTLLRQLQYTTILWITNHLGVGSYVCCACKCC